MDRPRVSEDDMGVPDDLLSRIERYYDTVPRARSRTQEVGPFTLFVANGGWPYYARPRLGHSEDITPDDVRAVLRRQRELRVPEALEWVDETTPRLMPTVQATGRRVARYPLMVLDVPFDVTLPPGVRVRLLDADDPALASTQAAISLGFDHGGTAVGSTGVQARDAAAAASAAEAHDWLRAGIRDGLTSVACAEDASGPVAGGSHAPRGEVSEVTGVATLPAMRRRGIGAGVTAALVHDARRRGVRLVFLSAGSDEIASVYPKVGFRRVGTACVSE